MKTAIIVILMGAVIGFLAVTAYSDYSKRIEKENKVHSG